jgi:hypothetical protein
MWPFVLEDSTKLDHPEWTTLEIREYSLGETLKSLVRIVHSQAAGYI